MTRIVALVPMRHDSERVVGKNYRPLAGRPLYHHVIEALSAVDLIQEIIIDTDSPVILDDARRCFPDVTLLMRPENLRAGEIPMNEVLINSLLSIEADAVIQTHSTNPFLSADTIENAVSSYIDGRAEGTFDSVFGVSRIQARLWTKDAEPLNHDPTVLLRTQDLDPVYLENSCFYIFDPEQLRTTGNRIGSSPRMIEVPQIEAIDIDEEADFTLAIAVADSGVLSNDI
jgi:CMP-N-acetylneuraminic acid synthetase